MDSLTTNQPTATKWITQLPSSTALLDKNLNLIDASANWFTTFNFNRKNVIGESFLSLFPRFSESWEDSLEYALEGLTDIKVIDKMPPDEEPEQDFVWHLNPWKDGYGKTVGVILNVKDVTEKKALELELKQTQILLNEKSQIAKIGSWEYKIDSRKMYWSNEIRSIFGVPKDYNPTFDASISFFSDKGSREAINNLVQIAIESGKPWNKNLEINTFQGKSIWVNTIGRPKFKNGRCVRIIGTVQDITESMPLQEEKVRKVEHITSVQPIFDVAPTGMAIIDLQNETIIDINKHLSQLLGKSKNLFIGNSYKSFVSLKKSEIIQLTKELNQNNVFGPIEKRVLLENNEEIFLKLKGKKIDDDFDSKILLSCENVTKYKVQEEVMATSLQKSEEELDKIVHFSHMVSHNLKSHATNFDLLLNFLNNEQDSDERENLLKMLFKATDNLTGSIKGLRELVDIRYKIDDEKKSIKFNDYVYKVLENYNGLVKQEGVKVFNEISDDVTVKAIPNYLENILSNLIVNAIKFRKADQNPILVISAEKTDSYTIFSIEDNGIGMDLSKVGDKLFALYRTLHSIDRSRGMGLYLTKYQVDLMKGKIEVDSELDRGSAFKVYFPN
jgi:signal transduction histidine kinase